MRAVRCGTSDKGGVHVRRRVGQPLFCDVALAIIDCSLQESQYCADLAVHGC